MAVSLATHNAIPVTPVTADATEPATEHKAVQFVM